MTNVKFKFSALWQSRIRGQENDLSSKFRVCNDILYKHAISSIKTYQWDEQKNQEIISEVFLPHGHEKFTSAAMFVFRKEAWNRYWNQYWNAHAFQMKISSADCWARWSQSFTSFTFLSLPEENKLNFVRFEALKWVLRSSNKFNRTGRIESS